MPVCWGYQRNASSYLLCVSQNFKIVLNLQMTYIIIAHTYEQWDR